MKPNNTVWFGTGKVGVCSAYHQPTSVKGDVTIFISTITDLHDKFKMDTQIRHWDIIVADSQIRAAMRDIDRFLWEPGLGSFESSSFLNLSKLELGAPRSHSIDTAPGMASLEIGNEHTSKYPKPPKQAGLN